MLRWVWLGRTPYGEALELQRRTRDDVLAGRGPETLLLMEHPPVVTLGPRATAGDLRVSRAVLKERGVEVWEVDRGGLATWHGPGQLVGYPIVRVGGAGVGVARFVTRVGRALAGWVGARGVAARFDARRTGVFVEDPDEGGEARREYKIAAMGIHVHGGVTTHGFALNLTSDPTAFDVIVPCGEPAGRATSLSAWVTEAPEPAAAAPGIASVLAGALGRALAVAALLTVAITLQPGCGTGAGEGPGGGPGIGSSAIAATAAPAIVASTLPKTVLAIDLSHGGGTSADVLEDDVTMQAVVAGLHAAGLTMDETATVGFRANVSVVYGHTPGLPAAGGSASPGAAATDTATSGTGAMDSPPAWEVLVRVDLSLVPVVENRAGRAFDESGAASSAADEVAPGQLRVLRRLAGDLAGIMVARIWPGGSGPHELRRGLRSKDPAERIATLERIEAAKEVALAHDVVALVDDPEASVAARAVGVLASLGDPAVVPELTRSARRKIGPIFYSLLDTIGQLGGSSAKPYLRAVADAHPDPEARARAEAALRAMKRSVPR